MIMKLTVNTQKEKAELGSMFGIFFEDLNHAADGGLYAELVRNRSFEFAPVDNPAYHSLTAWETFGDEDFTEVYVTEGNAVSSKNPHYLVIKVKEGQREAGAVNCGFNSGIPYQAGGTYFFTCFVRAAAGAQTAKARIALCSAEGSIYEEQELKVTDRWEKQELTFRVSETDTSGRLKLTVCGEGEVDFDFVSLFPADTYKGRRNGLRRDLAEALEAMHPKFMRFPGGCLVHDGSLNAEDRDSQYRWKNSIGPLWERPARRSNWGYNQTLGLGYYEYFVLCEDIGAKPVPVLPGGYDPHHHRAADGKQLQEFIQDALDLIEFANGTEDTVWGKKRADMGHPKPFGMEYLGIGNEEIGEPFFERFPLFQKAVKEAYPKIRLIGTSGPFAAGKEYERGWKSAVEDGADLVDEHFYQSPEWFIANIDRYNTFLPQMPHVFLGEYASKANTWFNALAEAAFMTGLQNNAPAVELACYAPLFCNVDYVNWKPDMIWYDNHQIMYTPNYYVQKLFMEHQGDTLLEQTLEDMPQPVGIGMDEKTRMYGGVVLSGDETEMEFTGITLTDEDSGECIRIPRLHLGTGETSESIGTFNSNNYTICLRAREISGRKGFKISFAQKDKANRLFWQFGGWENADSMIGEDIRGNNSVLTQRSRSVEQNRTYDVEIRVRDHSILVLLDGEEELKTEIRPVMAQPFYSAASRDADTGEIILKLVNLLPQEQETEICLQDIKTVEGAAYVIEGYERDDTAQMGEIGKFLPEKKVLAAMPGSFRWKLAPQSVCILRLQPLKQYSNKHTFEIRDDFYLDGQKIKIISGGVHYFRIHPHYWRDRLEKLKALGCNTVETYIPWNLHEKEKGEFCFEGMLDIVRFVRLAQELGLYVILRPSPYICAEWEFGGLPYWLLKEDGMRLRCMYSPYLEHVKSYYEKLFEVIAPLQITRGGPVIVMQVENEYGYYGDDREYLEYMKRLMLDCGCEVPLVTSDGPWGDAFDCGKIEGVLQTGNFGSKGAEQFAAMKEKIGAKPLMCMEFWVGWFDSWGAECHQTGDIEEHKRDLDEILSRGHVNIYMFIGGTNFGFTSGSNYYDELTPDVTSYDYDALLTEDGQITPKYEAFKEVISKYTAIPEVPLSAKIERKAYGTLAAVQETGLFENLANLASPVEMVCPMSMERIGQGYGYILYESEMKYEGNIEKLRLWGANDRANIFVDETPAAVLYDRELLEEHLFEPVLSAGNSIQILVENMGRVNFGPMLEHQRKGIDGAVQINGHQHYRWRAYALPMEDLSRLDFEKPHRAGTPGFYKFELEADEPGDTFLDFAGWGKGCVQVNGFLLGRFWEAGPQKRLYIPAPLLKKGKNEIILFESDGKAPGTIRLMAEADLG